MPHLPQGPSGCLALRFCERKKRTELQTSIRLDRILQNQAGKTGSIRIQYDDTGAYRGFALLPRRVSVMGYVRVMEWTWTNPKFLLACVGYGKVRGNVTFA